MLTEGQRLGVYRSVRLLGEGGMGAVYEARQEPLERRVALKTLHADHAKSKEFIARFFNEAKVLSRLALPTTQPSLVQTPEPTEERLDLGVASPASALDLPSRNSNPESVASCAARGARMTREQGPSKETVWI